MQDFDNHDLEFLAAQARAERVADDLRDEVERLRSENEALRKGLDAVESLIAESGCVYGLHLNGDVAPWVELRTGGRIEEWLADFDAAIANVKGDQQ